jgi:hypothetical protein
VIGIVAKKKPNWDAIKAEYLKGIPAPELAQRYKVNLATLKSKASREKWGRDRNEIATIVQLETPRKIADTVLSEVERITRRHFDVWDKALTKAEGMLDHREEVPVLGEDGQPVLHPETGEVLTQIIEKVGNPRALKEWATGVKAVTEGQRLAAGIIDPNKVKTDPATQDEEASNLIILPADSENWRTLADRQKPASQEGQEGP